ncbi:ephrin-B2 isoform X2 [Lingula anatina]|uniref:Ephrin-B2 isoform X2 n=1 Tax=Lingula anatina TaxID=7574 RepID=A0A1S3I522_LINAN|nr:ephrin-B2 isoform X2 [Lingula anatina]|eukprot:XP_013392931.1 ephrin-B2 isoform X2 [Lingula anatina]
MLDRARRTYRQTLEAMPWFLSRLCLYLIVLSLQAIEEGSTSSGDTMNVKVFWNATNPIFQTSNNDHVIEVRINDVVDFHCPKYTSTITDPNDAYYVIYQVSKKEYDECKLFENEPRRIEIINCSRPARTDLFTLLILPHTGIPGSLEFNEGMTYYYITTSTGNLTGINNRRQGACREKNMKIMLKVCCDSSTRSPHCTNTQQYRKCPITTSTQSVSTTTTPTTTSSTTPTTTTTTLGTTKHKFTTTSSQGTTHFKSTKDSHTSINSSKYSTEHSVWLLCISLLISACFHRHYLNSR